MISSISDIRYVEILPNHKASLMNIEAGLRFALGRESRALRLWRLTVRDVEQLTPHMRRLRFSVPDLADLRWSAGQDLVLNLPGAPRRHYTIRDVRDGLLTIDFVLHGHGAASEWAAAAQPGERIEALGPRGRTRLTEDADWRLFVGDETCIPAIFAMIEALPAKALAIAFIEVESLEERQPLQCVADARVEWVVRGGPARPNGLLLEKLKSFDPPPGVGHAYVIGETSGVRAERHHLLESGWPKERITAEGYWRPGRVGGHDHV
jgi:NADPH-dependent ferric siderophore reductase